MVSADTNNTSAAPESSSGAAALAYYLSCRKKKKKKTWPGPGRLRSNLQKCQQMSWPGIFQKPDPTGFKITGCDAFSNTL